MAVKTAPNILRAVHHFIALAILTLTPHTTLQLFYGPLSPGPPGWAGARRELLDFMVQGKINRGRHTDHPAGPTPSGLTSAYLHHPPKFFTGLMPFLPPNQQHQTTEGN